MRFSPAPHHAPLGEDARFFLANPMRTHRVREPLAHEMKRIARQAAAHPGEVPFVAVRRLTGACWLTVGWAPTMPPDHEELAHLMFDVLQGLAGGLSVADALARARATERTAQMRAGVA